MNPSADGVGSAASASHNSAESWFEIYFALRIFLSRLKKKQQAQKNSTRE